MAGNLSPEEWRAWQALAAAGAAGIADIIIEPADPADAQGVTAHHAEVDAGTGHMILHIWHRAEPRQPDPEPEAGG